MVAHFLVNMSAPTSDRLRLLLERFPDRRNRKGIPESAKIGFMVEAGLEAGWDGQTLFRRSSRARRSRGRGGSSRHEAAGRFGVSVSFVAKLMQRFHATGRFQPSDFGGHGKPKLAEHEAVVRELVEQTPSATLLELRGALLERGIPVGKPSIGRFLKRLRISYKKALRGRADASGRRRRARPMA
jgi:transposase